MAAMKFDNDESPQPLTMAAVELHDYEASSGSGDGCNGALTMAAMELDDDDASRGDGC